MYALFELPPKGNETNDHPINKTVAKTLKFVKAIAMCGAMAFCNMPC